MPETTIVPLRPSSLRYMPAATRSSPFVRVRHPSNGTNDTSRRADGPKKRCAFFPFSRTTSGGMRASVCSLSRAMPRRGRAAKPALRSSARTLPSPSVEHEKQSGTPERQARTPPRGKWRASTAARAARSYRPECGNTTTSTQFDASHAGKRRIATSSTVARGRSRRISSAQLPVGSSSVITMRQSAFCASIRASAVSRTSFDMTRGACVGQPISVNQTAFRPSPCRPITVRSCSMRASRRPSGAPG